MDAARARGAGDALPRHQLLTGPCGERFDELVAQVDEVLDRQGVRAAAVCGVSFGGMVAVKFAASRPERTSALVIVSTPSPAWTPSAAQARYLARPWLSTPAFLATAPGTDVAGDRGGDRGNAVAAAVLRGARRPHSAPRRSCRRRWRRA